ncbi:hypothetical protein PVNG_06306 [Plasmodium vivax North Korean]|uniref:PIR Superfamily Protein n=1 Tax=Plasmodium vivax North Korean TaxID=1035514 RepID=A0A0J9U145_PLAVI|nr:hypothetical protein PVNG_06306 [Plasmodium vivax North Korean]
MTCRKLVNYLKNNYEQGNNGDLKDHHCDLLSHWIYEQLHKKFEGKYGKIVHIYGEMEHILSKVLTSDKESKAIKCLHDVTVFSGINKWKESKDLYDYCVDYDKIM